MKNNTKIIIVFLLMLLVGSSLMQIYTTDKFEERYGRKPENICEGSVSVGVIPMGYCEELLGSKQEKKVNNI